MSDFYNWWTQPIDFNHWWALLILASTLLILLDHWRMEHR